MSDIFDQSFNLISAIPGSAAVVTFGEILKSVDFENNVEYFRANTGDVVGMDPNLFELGIADGWAKAIDPQKVDSSKLRAPAQLKHLIAPVLQRVGGEQFYCTNFVWVAFKAEVVKVDKRPPTHVLFDRS